MSFRLVPKSVTLNDLERRNSPYFAYFTEFVSFQGTLRKSIVEDVVVRKFTFAVSSPDEFLVLLLVEACRYTIERSVRKAMGRHISPKVSPSSGSLGQ